MSSYPSIYSCPSCGRVVSFQHGETNITTCPCGSVLKKQEGALSNEAIYLIQKGNDLIQIGTEGTWDGKKFKVLGRFRAWIEEYVFNYWTISFEDGKLAYLGEGYGLYAIYESREDVEVSYSFLNDIKVGQNKEFFDEIYLVERKYKCHKWEAEGELFLSDVISNFRVIEVAHTDGRRLELLEGKYNKLIAFSVFYTSYSDLHLTNLENTDTYSKTISCAACSKRNEVKELPYVQSYACAHCGTRYSLQEDSHFKKLSDSNKSDDVPNITLGAKGIIKGFEYEVIGFAVKEEQNSYHSKWKEYTLYNRAEGFAFLSEYNGHWIYVREKGDGPVLPLTNAREFKFYDEPFQLYNSYRFKTIAAAGCFPYNVFNDGDKDVKEFISPPEVWIMEKNTREGIVWFLGEHLNRSDLQKTFGEALIMPPKEGVGAIEPKGFVNPFKLATVTFFAVLFLLAIHLLTSSGKMERVLLSQDINFPDSVNTISFVSQKFQLEKWRSNLEFNVYAPVDNSWFELAATLVNTKTGTEYSLEKGVEYYHGYSDGESWSEGDTRASAYLSQIPAGEYQLQVQGIRESQSSFFAGSATRNFSLTVTYDVSNDRNLLYCLIALLIFPIIKYYISNYYEKNRWYNSPYSPYSYDD